MSKFFDGYGKIIDCRVMTGQLWYPLVYFLSHEVDAEMYQALGLLSSKVPECVFFLIPVLHVDFIN